jgi:hypothetical protein
MLILGDKAVLCYHAGIYTGLALSAAHTVVSSRLNPDRDTLQANQMSVLEAVDSLICSF